MNETAEGINCREPHWVEIRYCRAERKGEIESLSVGNPVTAQRSALTFITPFIATLRRAIDTSLPQSRTTTLHQHISPNLAQRSRARNLPPHTISLLFNTPIPAHDIYHHPNLHHRPLLRKCRLANFSKRLTGPSNAYRRAYNNSNQSTRNSTNARTPRRRRSWRTR